MDVMELDSIAKLLTGSTSDALYYPKLPS